MFPSDEGEWKLSWKAEITAEAAESRGIDICQGTIQEINKTDNGLSLTLAVFNSGSVSRLYNLNAEDLKRIKDPS